MSSSRLCVVEGDVVSPLRLCCYRGGVIVGGGVKSLSRSCPKGRRHVVLEVASYAVASRCQRWCRVVVKAALLLKAVSVLCCCRGCAITGVVMLSLRLHCH
jgi:hypothetical protein